MFNISNDDSCSSDENDSYNTEERRRERNYTRFLLTLPVIIPLILMTGVALILRVLSLKGLASDVPIFIVMSGIIVIFFGSFYDFGAKNYLSAAMEAKMKIREEDITQINREQLIMNGIYAGLGTLYIVVGIVINFIV